MFQNLQIANEMWYRNEFLVDQKSFDLYKKAMEGEENVKLLAALNIREFSKDLVLKRSYKREEMVFSSVFSFF